MDQTSVTAYGYTLNREPILFNLGASISRIFRVAVRTHRAQLSIPTVKVAVSQFHETLLSLFLVDNGVDQFFAIAWL